MFILKKVLIGSKAIKHYFPDFRDCKDTDFLVDGDIINHDDIEYFDCNRGTGLSLFFDSCDEIPTINELYTLKLSHSFWNINWEKTVCDLRFLQQKNATVDEELFQLLYQDWVKIHGPKKAYLSKNNEDFFKDGVDRAIPHDTIHQAIAYYDEPMFKKLKKNPDSAMISKEMFFKLDHEHRIKTCREEIYATAIERFLLKDCKSSLVAYRNSIKLLVTSMTKGWFPRFIMENINELWLLDGGYNYFEKFRRFIDGRSKNKA